MNPPLLGRLRRGGRLLPVLVFYVCSFLSSDNASIATPIGFLFVTALLFRGKQISTAMERPSPAAIAALVGAILFPHLLFALTLNDPNALSVPNGNASPVSVPIAGGDFQLLPSWWSLLLYLVPVLWFVKNRADIPWAREASVMKISVLTVLAIAPVICSRVLFRDFFQSHYSNLSVQYRVLMVAKSFYYAAGWEEIYYRGMLLSMLRLWGGDKLAILLSSGVFLAAHLTFWPAFFAPTPFVLCGIFLLGLACAYSVVRTESLVPAFLFHGFANASPFLASLIHAWAWKGWGG